MEQDSGARVGHTMSVRASRGDGVEPPRWSMIEAE
jgi:hypothetical protein